MTEVFTHEFPLVLSGNDERRLRTRFDLAPDVYNALLAESLRRLQLMRESRTYRRAGHLRGDQRRRLFRQARRDFGLLPFDLYAWASRRVTPSWINDHLDTQTVRGLAERAIRATWEFQLGKRGRPRFKGRNQVDSIESQSNVHALRFREGRVLWRGLSLRAKFDPEDPYVRHALAARIKRIRIFRRRIGCAARYFVQLVCEGDPYRDSSRRLGSGLIGIDPGPRVFALAGSDWASRVDLAVDLSSAQRDVRLLERSIERKRRANNPRKFLRDGQVVQSPGGWRVSKSELRIRAKLNDIHRRTAARRRTLHGTLSNALLSLGNEFRIERNAFNAFQRRFGKSVNVAAPGEFVKRLTRKAANAGGKVALLPTLLRLSQTCHRCGSVQAKSLSQRVHNCSCGLGPVQRDIYSAVLATMTMFDPLGSIWRLDADQADRVWSGVGSRLPAASSPLSIQDFVSWAEEKAANGEPRFTGSFGITQLAGAKAATADEVRDVVGTNAEGPGESAWSAYAGSVSEVLFSERS